MTEHAVLRTEFSEVKDFTAQLRGIEADAVALRPGRFAGSLCCVQLGDITIQVVRSAPALLLATAAPGTAGLIQVLEGAGPARWNGQRIGAEQVALLAERSHYDAAFPEAFACTVISFDVAAHADDKALAEDRAPRSGGWPAALRPDPGAHAALAAIGCAIEDAMASGCAALRVAEARRALRASILDAARALLAPPDSARRPHERARCARQRRQRIVHAADDHLRANPARPIYTDELCAALGVSATSLHQAFRATFGISPHRYLKLRRMGMVRAALLSRSGPWHSVKAIALSHGFWHLGQFAHDYGALYGESPSGTLARAQGGIECRRTAPSPDP